MKGVWKHNTKPKTHTIMSVGVDRFADTSVSLIIISNNSSHIKPSIKDEFISLFLLSPPPHTHRER